jgi:hypothetical protein
MVLKKTILALVRRNTGTLAADETHAQERRVLSDVLDFVEDAHVLRNKRTLVFVPRRDPMAHECGYVGCSHHDRTRIGSESLGEK